MMFSIQLPDPNLTAVKLLDKIAITSPPVDLEKIAAIWPDLSIVEEDLDGAGYLLPIGELGGEILVNSSDREERKRFTIAHELGHWVLGISLKRKTGHFSQPKAARYSEIERWCDAFATNLLMPEKMVRAWVPKDDPVLVIDSLTMAASRFKVSEEAFFLRVWETLRMQIALLSTSGGEIRIERNFADPKTDSAIYMAIKDVGVVDQIRRSPIVHFALSSSWGKIRGFGRRLNNDRITLVIRWPNTAVEEPQSQPIIEKASE